MYLKNSRWPPWYELTATPCTSSWRAAVTISSTERLWPRWITSAPFSIRIRRTMLIAASWPSNSAAAVTRRTLFFGRLSAAGIGSVLGWVMGLLGTGR